MDLTVVINCHREDELLRTTLLSVNDSIEFATNRGISCQLLIVADCASETTSELCKQWQKRKNLSYPVKIKHTKFGNPGEARNLAARATNSKYLAYCDGDDLVSENYLFECIVALEQRSEPSIAHPEFLISFGDWSGVWHISPEGVTQSYRDLISENLWCSSSVALTQTYLEIPYAPLTASQGYGPEDWYWNIETTEKGIKHFSVTDTCFFYRKRNSGGVNNTHGNSLLPPINISALSVAMPYRPRNILDKSTLRTVATKSYSKMKKKMSWLRQGFPRTSNLLYRAFRRTYSIVFRIPPSKLGSAAAFGELHYSPVIKNQVQKATWIEPGISWTAFGLEKLHVHSAVDSSYAEVLEKLINELGEKPEQIVAVPWVGIGGADLVSLNYADALSEISQRGKAIILSTGAPERTRLDLIPSSVKFVQIDPRFQSFSEDVRSRLLAQAITISRPKLVIAVNCFDLVNSLRRYGKQISEVARIYLTFFAFDRIGENYPTQPITDGSRDFLKYISGILTDNKNIANYLAEILGKKNDFFKIHYQPAFGNFLDFENKSIPSSTEVKNHVIRLLWPHRLDKEKRPEVLLEIAKFATAQNIEIEIDIFGQAVLSDQLKSLQKQFKELNIRYRGPYQGGLSVLPIEEYHGLLVTSESEGMPIVVLQSMMLGLPVISTNVGGINEVITNGISGYLVDGPNDISGFISAIQELKDETTRQEIAKNAKIAVKAQHSWSSFKSKVIKLTFDS